MKTQNRWLIIAASFIANIIIGSAYAWSVFASALQAAPFYLTAPQTTLAFNLSLGLVPLAMIVAGKLHGKIGIKTTILIGGLFFGAGFALAHFMPMGTAVQPANPLILFLTYGVMGGIGIGLVYGSTVANAVSWFPDKRGLAGGIAAGGFGLGAVLFAPIFGPVIDSVGPQQTFLIFGIVLGAVAVLCSFFIVRPPVGYAPHGWNPPAVGTAGGTSSDLNVVGMLKAPKFYFLWIMYTLACVTGLMIISQASPITQIALGYDVGAAAATGATAVFFLGLANTGGRFLWGAISDKIGRYPTLILMYAVTIGGLIVLSFAADFLPVVIGLIAVGICFGGFLGVYPSICAESFGTKNLGMNYGVLFTAFGVAAFAGPQIAANIRAATGVYTSAFIITIIMSAVAILITIFYWISMK
ncbi:MAG: OFA family MFS transporter, partial [Oscillospiraceae bacterium]|nr:OFA family MFS transporter [Oscillospiraceae bacterium]